MCNHNIDQSNHLICLETKTWKRKKLPGSMPSVFGAWKTGARMVRFFIVTFLQSYGWRVQKGESRNVMLDITMSLDHIICTSGPLVWFRSFRRYFFHHAWPCPLMVPLCPVMRKKTLRYSDQSAQLQIKWIFLQIHRFNANGCSCANENWCEVHHFFGVINPTSSSRKEVQNAKSLYVKQNSPSSMKFLKRKSKLPVI